MDSDVYGQLHPYMYTQGQLHIWSAVCKRVQGQMLLTWACLEDADGGTSAGATGGAVNLVSGSQGGV